MAGAPGDRPDVVLRSPQTLILSPPGTTSSGSKAPVADRTWCSAPRKPLFLRRRAPRLPGPRRRRRAGRGASLPANPYYFVVEHHVFRIKGAGGGPDVVRRSPQTLILSSPSTTSSGAKAPVAGRTWCSPPRKPLFFRHRAPRLPGPRCRCWRGPTVEYGFAGSQAPTWPAVGRNESETWCKGNGGSRACGNSCTKSVAAARRKWPETWCKGNGGTRLCGVSCAKSSPTSRRKWPETWCTANGGTRLCGNSCTKSPPVPRREIQFFISNSMTFLRIRKN